MKPSWAVMKLMLACGRRPSSPYEIARAGEAVAEIPELGPVADPEVADGVAIAPVPFAPQNGEVSDLVALGAEIPRLGDELHARQDRVLVNDVEERAQLVHVLEVARERRGEIEAEAVHVHLDCTQ